jgi:hypothetical protein
MLPVTFNRTNDNYEQTEYDLHELHFGLLKDENQEVLFNQKKKINFKITLKIMQECLTTVYI